MPARGPHAIPNYAIRVADDFHRSHDGVLRLLVRLLVLEA